MKKVMYLALNLIFCTLLLFAGLALYTTSVVASVSVMIASLLLLPLPRVRNFICNLSDGNSAVLLVLIFVILSFYIHDCYEQRAKEAAAESKVLTEQFCCPETSVPTQ